jgi:hypothetical protein
MGENASVCFSAEASFAVGGALIPAGIFCIGASLLKKPSHLGLAAVPLFFGIQQISEGMVWLSLEHDSGQTRIASLVFLFFALAFWPFWFPFMTALTEPEPWRKALFAGITFLALGWFWVLYYPLLTGPETMLETVRVHHSIDYQYSGLAIYNYIPKAWLRVLYFASVALPPMLGSQTWGRMPGMVLGASAIVAVLVFDHAFVSVWCFFAAALSAYCCVVFYRLPRREVDTIGPSPPESIAAR